MAAMRWMPVAIIGLLLLGGNYNPVTAEDADAEGEEGDEDIVEASGPVHPLTDIPDEADGVETVYMVPTHPDLRVVGGEKVDIVLGFRNGADEDLNITGIMGSINSPMDFSMHVQNFTLATYGIMVPPGGEVSVPYSFEPSTMLNPLNFATAVTVFYHGQEEDFASTFFNTTIEIVEKPSFLIDTQTLFLYLMLLGILSIIGYFVAKPLQKLGLMKKKRATVKKVETGTSGDRKDEWLSGTAPVINEKAKTRRAAATRK